MWWDYHVKPGDSVSYQVIPVTGSAASLKEDTALASEWTDTLKVTGQCTPNISAYFNKGIVAAQWVSRELDQEAQGKNRQSALKEIIAKPGDPLRNALTGLLKDEILQLLKDAGGEVYAALYELNDPELIDALTSLGKSAHVILANGAFSPKEPDENAAARATLRKAGVEVFDRMVSSGHFAHNKFAVICDSVGRAKKVLSGSTNWTSTGLCTQANNGLIIQDPAVAGRFLQEWHSLQQAGNLFPKDLVAGNSKLSQFHVDDVQITTWFAPTSAAQDMDYARKLIANAKDGILFLFFNPGTYQEDATRETLLQNVLDRRANPKVEGNDLSLYIRGVVNQEIANLTSVYDGTDQTLRAIPRAAMVPAAIKEKFHAWEDEALRASMVMVHSKVIVIDPFGAYPVLMTGSHNLGLKASQKNDDNLVILEGPHAGPLAAAYAVNIIGTYQTYRWNHYITDAKAADTWHGLQDDDKWQQGHLSGSSLDELKFWMAEHLTAEAEQVHATAAGAGASTPPVAAHPAHRTTTKKAAPAVHHARSTKKPAQ